LNYFQTDKQLDSHTKDCEKINEAKISFSKDKHVQFKDFIYKQKTPFVMYADFESMLVPFEEPDEAGKSKKYQKHVLYSAGYYLKCSYDDSLSKYEAYRGVNCMEWFQNQLGDIAKFVESKMRNIVPMVNAPTKRDGATHCHICESAFNSDSKARCTRASGFAACA